MIVFPPPRSTTYQQTDINIRNIYEFYSFHKLFAVVAFDVRRRYEDLADPINWYALGVSHLKKQLRAPLCDTIEYDVFYTYMQFDIVQVISYAVA